jgi:hypothetical protein
VGSYVGACSITLSIVMLLPEESSEQEREEQDNKDDRES